MRRGIAWLLAVAAIGGGVARAATVTVTGAGDGTAVDGFVTLREALTSINVGVNLNLDVVAAGPYGTDDRIEFAIAGAGVHSIHPVMPLPALAVPMTIDGYTQPGASPNTQATSDDAVLLVEIEGSGAGLGAVGLTIPAAAGGSTVRGLVINRFVADPMGAGGHGIVLTATSDCVVAGNFLGTGATGSGIFPNGGVGVRLINESIGNTVGGADPADRNLIGGYQVGISIEVDCADNAVVGNFVGVDATGSGGAPNGNGVRLLTRGFGVNLIGGTAAGEGNVISANAGVGIVLADGTQGTFVRGNLIGTDATGTAPLPNVLDGIRIFDGVAGGSNFNTLGGTTAEAGNVIAHNLGNGINILTVPATGNFNLGNTIRGNRIFANGLLGIDLGDDGASPNDPGDADGGQNNGQNFPLLVSAVSSGGSTTVTGNLDSTPNGFFLVSFYASPSCDPSGFGEGETFLGIEPVATDGAGIGPIAVNLPVAVLPGYQVTAVASVSDPTGDSSEFSPCVTVEEGAGVVEIPALGPAGLLLLGGALALAALAALRRTAR